MKKNIGLISAAIIICALSACAKGNPNRIQMLVEARASSKMQQAHAHYGVGMMYMIEASRLDFERKSAEAAENWRHAAESFELAAQADPGGAEIFEALITCYARLGDGNQAIRALERLAESIPDDAEARLEMAQTFKALDMDDNAVEQYRRALELAPEGSDIEREIILEFAAHRKAAGKTQEAEDILRPALERDPEDSVIRAELAFVVGELEGHDEAIELLLPLLMPDEPKLGELDFSTAVFFLANEFENAGKREEGVEAFEKLLQAHPDNDSVCQAAMLMMQSAGKPERAAEIGEQFLERHPDKHAALLILAAIYEKMEEYDKSLALYRHALDRAMPYSSVTARQMLAIAEKMRERGEMELALEVLNEVLEVDDIAERLRGIAAQQAALLLWDMERRDEALEKIAPVAETPDADWHTVMIYSSLLVEAGRVDEAEERLTDALDTYAGQPNAMLNLYFTLGNLRMLEPEAQEKSEKHLRNALAIQHDHAPSANSLAYMFSVFEKNLDEAEKLVNIALEQEPDEPAYIDTLGWVKYKKALRDDDPAELAEAVQLLKNAAEMELDNILLDHLGDALYVTGEWEEAIETWRAALALEDRPGGESLDRALAQHKIETTENKLREEAEEHEEPLPADKRRSRPLAPPPSKPPNPN